MDILSDGGNAPNVKQYDDCDPVHSVHMLHCFLANTFALISHVINAVLYDELCSSYNTKVTNPFVLVSHVPYIRLAYSKALGF